MADVPRAYLSRAEPRTTDVELIAPAPTNTVVLLCSTLQRIGVRELRQHASRYLALVARGERVEVTDRGRPVAMLVPVRGAAWDDFLDTGRRLASGTDAMDLADEAPLEYGAEASAALRAMRDHERWRLYLDSSALVKLVQREAESDALRRYLRAHRLDERVASELVRVERASPQRSWRRTSRGVHARRQLARLYLVLMDRDVLDHAATLAPASMLRSLDAIHLATAQLLGADLRRSLRMTSAWRALPPGWAW